MKGSQLTFSGIDERTPMDFILWLVHMGVEPAFLFSKNPDGRSRYPWPDWLEATMKTIPHKCAVHICGAGARVDLLNRTLPRWLTNWARRIQVNGILSVWEVDEICRMYPSHTIITQHHCENESLLGVVAVNHAILVDGSAGRGKSPSMWIAPDVKKPVGFAGGLGPHNIAEQFPIIQKIARRGAWVDMETHVRTGDWFDTNKAINVIDYVFNRRLPPP